MIIFKIMTRWELIEKFIFENGYKKIAEIGVAEGGMAKRVIEKCTGALDCYIMVDYLITKRLYAVLLETDLPGYLETEYQKNPIVLMRMDSIKASEIIANESLDLVFIDCQHEYEYVKKDIKAWLPKVKKGGIISGHDYNPKELYVPGFNGVGRAVNEEIEEINLEHDDAEPDGNNNVWWKKV